MPASRASISQKATLRLWVVAGGRCEYCNAYLLEDEFTTYTLNLGERAHIVGATDAPGSPRSDTDFPLDERNEAANLMLLCAPHHHVIDQLIEQHTVEGLRQMKRVHEDRIRLLTGLREDAETVVLRVIGGIRGAPVEIAADTVLAAVRRAGRFPRYRLATAGEDIEVDLRGLPDEGDPAYWTIGARTIEQAAARIRHAQQPIRHLSVFALTRIPLLIALGFHLDDKVPTTTYQRRRDGTGDKGWGYDPDAAPIDFDIRKIAGPPSGDRVALAVSLSASVAADAITAVGDDHTVYEITPSGVPPSRDVLTARASLDQFAHAYHRTLELIEVNHGECVVIDVFAAVPAAAAIQLGRGLMRGAQPGLRVHDRDANGGFRPALTLGQHDIADG